MFSALKTCSTMRSVRKDVMRLMPMPRQRNFARSLRTSITNQHPDNSVLFPPQKLSVAPMMEWTDPHYRHLARLLTHHTWLYTEMVVDKTLLYNPDSLEKWLEFSPIQHPVVLQLGGSDPESLGAAARLTRPFQYDEINLNCGCPSEKVAGAGCFGASLMLEPELVADCASAIAEGGNVEVTIKCRIGYAPRTSIYSIGYALEHLNVVQYI
ncbi:hypothetical protein CYMTET_33285 [Cymbomonas tetramitiformis]|uniref:DUS-like FMN-binding domain-containing protein n=1 Tax=Cymbomonas tetramitiformis TaxID=36881 RepID=A0AAE0FDJ4_9CHLO|nr:hypothetical protein CYMTET_33285 [Cymbomonas tetramitiformis]